MAKIRYVEESKHDSGGHHARLCRNGFRPRARRQLTTLAPATRFPCLRGSSRTEWAIGSNAPLAPARGIVGESSDLQAGAQMMSASMTSARRHGSGPFVRNPHRVARIPVGEERYAPGRD
jgi:hypothetical protein